MASSDAEKKKKRLIEPIRVETEAGRAIYGFDIETFPNFFNNIYLLDDGARLVLFDCGSGFGASNENLTNGLAKLEESFGLRVGLSDLSAVVITHAHSDHFGGLGYVREHSEAPVSVHRLDLPVVSNYEERVVVASRQLAAFLTSAGLSPSSVDGLMSMYKAGKDRFHSLPAEYVLEEGDPVRDKQGDSLELETYHVPGHCPGQICVRVDDVLLTADHVLARITPHQAPESITLNTGLFHYLESLTKIEKVEGIRLGLGGHEQPIDDVPARVREIRAAHDERLGEVLAYCSEPRTTADISRELFGGLSGYTILLGLEEAGAHVEYLHQRGELYAANLEELERDGAAIRWLAS